MIRPLVSVIIPNRNYGRFLRQTIDSVLGQTYRNLEIIVVNNDSTDNSLDILKSFGDKILVINQENLGQSSARNTGIKQASGDFIALLDADDLWLPDKIESQVSLISNEAQLVYCGIQFVNSDANKVLGIAYPEHDGSCSKLFELSPWKAIVVGGESTALFSRELFEKVGGFNIQLSTASGWDFFRRSAAYTEFASSKDALVLYRQHSGNASRKRGLIYRDMVRSAYFCVKDQFTKKRFFSATLFIMRSISIIVISMLKEFLNFAISGKSKGA